MGDFDFGGAPTGDRYSKAQANQGFLEPTERSPFDTPPGWHQGSVRQTGGMIMAREWSTLPGGLNRRYESRPGGKYEYEVGYGENPGVSLIRYEWNGETGYYEFDEVLDDVPVDRNTDRMKAKMAQDLMQLANSHYRI